MSNPFPFPVPAEAEGSAAELARALEARAFTVAGYARQLRRVLLGVEPFPGEWSRSGIAPALFEASAQWLLASFTPKERFAADAVKAGGTFDRLVAQRVVDPPGLAGFLNAVFQAVMARTPLPTLDDPAVVAALQWLCDLFVDAGNAEPRVFPLVDAHLAAIAEGRGTVAQLCAALAEHAPLPDGR